jgi:hypothetical protein
MSLIPSNTTSEGRHGILATSIIILLALVIAYVFRTNLQHQTSFWIVTCVVTFIYLIFSLWFFTSKAPNTNGSSSQWLYILATFAFLGIVIGQVATAKSNRDQCISKTVLIDKSGAVNDPDAFIRFFKDCPSNPYHFDNVSESYIRANKRLPSWMLSNDLYTDDPVGFVRYYKSQPDNPYNLDDATVQKIYDTRQLPESLSSKGQTDSSSSHTNPPVNSH